MGFILTEAGRMLRLTSVVFVVLEYVGSLTVCVGASMAPTIAETGGDYVLLDKMSHRLHGVRKGDVIVARCPYDPRLDICKRVVAVEGETVQRGRKQVYIPKGHIWVEGDNKSNSNDSRHYGAVPLGLVFGHVRYRVWPLDRRGMIE
ncbi:Mitochondrial inner membrane protease subunit 1 [Porphyridium purpureum]|uniref:Mitochondrial inner membrane protease subunit 1 n=1 Tax=Porphyridium purpureum TaxID=35688 RepID=A0A5J4YU45_PORPP|nr:Mitochondrial inner membrane protease subunit 1 [Porphyridium purpureum]|eukprot:POR6148..scf229_5